LKVEKFAQKEKSEGVEEFGFLCSWEFPKPLIILEFREDFRVAD